MKSSHTGPSATAAVDVGARPRARRALESTDLRQPEPGNCSAANSEPPMVPPPLAVAQATVPTLLCADCTHAVYRVGEKEFEVCRRDIDDLISALNVPSWLNNMCLR
jgi:hypothetical protein